MLLAPSLLLFSTLTCYGLLALWAASSRWHWFARAALYLAAVSPVLLIPAYEPFVVLVVEGVTIAAGVQLATRRQRRSNGEQSCVRLSVRDALLGVPPLAVLCAVGVRLPALDAATWMSVVLIGFVAGLVSLMGAWIAVGPRLAWWGRLLIAFPLVVLLALPGVLWDQTLNAFAVGLGWPPEASMVAVWGGAPTTTPAWIALGLGLLLACTLLLMALAPLWQRSAQRRTWRNFLAVCSAVMVLLLAAPPAWVYWQLMNPLPIPNDPLPTPNGYDDLLAAAELVPNNPVVDSGNFDDESAPLAQLRAACQEMEPAILRAREGLTKRVWKPTDYKSDDLTLGQVQGRRTIARGMHAVGKLAQREGRIGDATDQYLELMEFGHCTARGGLIIDSLVGIACSGIACRGLYSVREEVAANDCPRIVERIREIENRLEPMPTYLHRDRIWTQHAYGWYGHLTQLLDDASDGGLTNMYSYEVAHLRHLATLRLLQLDLAVRAYRLENGAWPHTLQQLVPDYLAELPLDPFSTVGEPLRYRREGDAFLLYSVSLNHVDDDGEIPENPDGLPLVPQETGDFRLDLFFAPDQ